MARHPNQLLPGSVVLREALRTIRHIAREGRDTAAAFTRRTDAPGADFAFRGIDQIAGAVDGVADRIFHVEEPSVSLLADPRADADRFARAAYSALRQIQTAIGIRDTFVSELALRNAFADEGPVDGYARSARLLLRMRRDEVIFDTRMEPISDLQADEAGDLALLALFFWAHCDRATDDATAALEAAVVMALALKADYAEAGQDTDRLAALIEEFSPHV